MKNSLEGRDYLFRFLDKPFREIGKPYPQIKHPVYDDSTPEFSCVLQLRAINPEKFEADLEAVLTDTLPYLSCIRTKNKNLKKTTERMLNQKGKTLSTKKSQDYKRLTLWHRFCLHHPFIGSNIAEDLGLVLQLKKGIEPTP